MRAAALTIDCRGPRGDSRHRACHRQAGGRHWGHGRAPRYPRPAAAGAGRACIRPASWSASPAPTAASSPTGARGVCLVRARHGDALVGAVGVHGRRRRRSRSRRSRSSTSCPGSRALSFGMLGCDLHCAYCQNWITSQTLRDDEASDRAAPVTPRQLVDGRPRPRLRVDHLDLQRATHHGRVGARRLRARPRGRPRHQLRLQRPCHARGPRLHGPGDRRLEGGPQVVRRQDLPGAGRQAPGGPRRDRGHRRPRIWCEVVTLVVPGLNDSDGELRDIAGFLGSVSPDIPWHVTAFHPDYRMTGPPATPARHPAPRRRDRPRGRAALRLRRQPPRPHRRPRGHPLPHLRRDPRAPRRLHRPRPHPARRRPLPRLQLRGPRTLVPPPGSGLVVCDFVQVERLSLTFARSELSGLTPIVQDLTPRWGRMVLVSAVRRWERFASPR